MEPLAMPPASSLRTDINRILVWSVLMPSLIVWPFTSLMPVISLMNTDAPGVTRAVNAILLLSGFWGLATYAVFRAVLNKARAMLSDAGVSPDQAAWQKPRRSALSMRLRRLFIGIWATIWTILYAVVAVTSG